MTYVLEPRQDPDCRSRHVIAPGSSDGPDYMTGRLRGHLISLSLLSLVSPHFPTDVSRQLQFFSIALSLPACLALQWESVTAPDSTPLHRITFIWKPFRARTLRGTASTPAPSDLGRGILHHGCTKEEEKGSPDGEEWLGQVVHAVNYLQQLRRQGCAALGCYH